MVTGDVLLSGRRRQWRSPSLKILSCASAAIRCLRWLFPSVSSERWWSRKATRGDNADTSVCETIHARSNSQIFFSLFILGEIQLQMLGECIIQHGSWQSPAENAQFSTVLGRAQLKMHNSARFLAGAQLKTHNSALFLAGAHPKTHNSARFLAELSSRCIIQDCSWQSSAEKCIIRHAPEAT